MSILKLHLWRLVFPPFTDCLGVKAEAPDETDAPEQKTTATVTGDANSKVKDGAYIGFTDRDGNGYDTGTIMQQTPAQPLTVKNVTLYTPDDPMNTISATYVAQELAPEKGEAMLAAMREGQWITYMDDNENQPEYSAHQSITSKRCFKYRMESAALETPLAVDGFH